MVMKRVVAALILKDDLLLACQRTRHQPMPLKWEFPGGKIEEGEQPRDAMRRELEEELGIEADVGSEVARIVHQYPGGSSVELRFYEVRTYQGELENRIFREIRWVSRQELLGLDFLSSRKDNLKFYPCCLMPLHRPPARKHTAPSKRS
jgi:8-oxo-dGTP diphosphatase